MNTVLSWYTVDPVYHSIDQFNPQFLGEVFERYPRICAPTSFFDVPDAPFNIGLMFIGGHCVECNLLHVQIIPEHLKYIVHLHIGDCTTPLVICAENLVDGGKHCCLVHVRRWNQ